MGASQGCGGGTCSRIRSDVKGNCEGALLDSVSDSIPLHTPLLRAREACICSLSLVMEFLASPGQVMCPGWATSFLQSRDHC